MGRRIEALPCPPRDFRSEYGSSCPNETVEKAAGLCEACAKLSLRSGIPALRITVLSIRFVLPASVRVARFSP